MGKAIPGNYFPGMPTITCREEDSCAPFNKAELSSSTCLFPPKPHPAPWLGLVPEPGWPLPPTTGTGGGWSEHGGPDGCGRLQLGKQLHPRGESVLGAGRNIPNIPSGAGRREHIHQCCWDLASQHLPSLVLQGLWKETKQSPRIWPG